MLSQKKPVSKDYKENKLVCFLLETDIVVDLFEYGISDNVLTTIFWDYSHLPKRKSAN